MNKHSAALIMPYYGKLPNYFQLWLKTAGTNKNFTFMIFSDEDFSRYKIPENVKIFSMTFDELKSLIKPHLDFDFVLHMPYKLCDYKPLYGLIFRDYLNNYDFWGHCDPDIIWGDMSKFITDERLEKYDRIYRHGHLTLYRNTEASRTFALKKLPGWNIYYRDIYGTRSLMAYDEEALNWNLFAKFAKGTGGIYGKIDFADILPFNKQFICAQNNDAIPAFRWENGKLFGLAVNGDINKNIEFIYAHLQKREIKFNAGLENEDSFMIIPNEFVKNYEPAKNDIEAFMKPDDEYTKSTRQKYKQHKHKTITERVINFCHGGDVHKIKGLINKILGCKLPDVIYNLE